MKIKIGVWAEAPQYIAWVYLDEEVYRTVETYKNKLDAIKEAKEFIRNVKESEVEIKEW